MAKTLVIKTSMTTNTPKGSVSNGVLDKFLEYYKEKNNDEIIILDLNKDEAGNITLTDENMGKYFEGSDKYIDQLFAVDKLVVASPMTNFNYPAVLKNYLDKILVAGKTFKYKYDGDGASEGLAKHLKVQIITTQGAPKGWYPFGDHTISLEGTFKFMGTNVVKPLVVAGVKTKEMINLSVEETIKMFDKEIKESAQSF